MGAKTHEFSDPRFVDNDRLKHALEKSGPTNTPSVQDHPEQEQPHKEPDGLGISTALTVTKAQ